MYAVNETIHFQVHEYLCDDISPDFSSFNDLCDNACYRNRTLSKAFTYRKTVGRRGGGTLPGLVSYFSFFNAKHDCKCEYNPMFYTWVDLIVISALLRESLPRCDGVSMMADVKLFCC